MAKKKKKIVFLGATDSQRNDSSNKSATTYSTETAVAKTVGVVQVQQTVQTVRAPSYRTPPTSTSVQVPRPNRLPVRNRVESYSTERKYNTLPAAGVNLNRRKTTLAEPQYKRDVRNVYQGPERNLTSERVANNFTATQ